MVIYLIRFVANLLMVRFLRAFPVQGIYFISFFNNTMLDLPGEDEDLISPFVSPGLEQFLKVTILSVHVF